METKATPAFPFPETALLAVAAALLGVATVLATPPVYTVPSPPLFAGTLLGIVLALALAAGHAGLNPVLRHAYLLHFTVMAGAAALPSVLHFPGLLPGGGFLPSLAFAMLCAAPPAVLGVLFATAARSTGIALALAFLGAAAGVLLLQPPIPYLPLCLALVFGGGVLALRDSTPAPARGGGVALGVYLLLNVVAVLFLLPVLGAYLYWMLQNGPDISPADFLPFRAGLQQSAPQLKAAVFDLLSWWGVALGCGTLAAASALLLPYRRPTPALAIGSGLAVLLLASLSFDPAGPWGTTRTLLAASAIVLASGATMAVPRARRLPAAVFAFAVIVTLARGLFPSSLAYPPHAFTLFFLDALLLAIIWTIAYLGGSRILYEVADSPREPEPPE